MTHLLYCMKAALLVTAAVLLPATTRAAGDAGAPVLATQPSVTKKEAELLKIVEGIAATNVNRAIVVLEGEDITKGSPALDFALGNFRFQAGLFDRAAEAYGRALEKMPKFRAASMNLGRVHLACEQRREAIEVFGSIVKAGMSDTDCLLLLGHALLLEEQAVSAENAYRQALLLAPGNRDALFGLAKCLFEQERHREGAGLLGELLARYPRDRQLWSLRADTLIALDRTHDALVALECAKRMGCADAGMLATLGDLYLNVQRPADAVACYRVAFASEGPPAAGRLLRAVQALVQLEETGQAAVLLSEAEEARKARPRSFTEELDLEMLRLKAELTQQKGDLEAAMALYARTLKKNPLDGRTMLLLGDLRREKGRIEDAVMIYERAARIEGFEAEALIRQAQAEVERERYGRAVALLEAAQAFKKQAHVARYLDQLREMVR